MTETEQEQDDHMSQKLAEWIKAETSDGQITKQEQKQEQDKKRSQRWINMSSSATGCCAVQWAMWKGWDLTYHDRASSSEN